MSSQRYLKRVWRVPKDRGPAEYFGALVLKALRKHGWPAQVLTFTDMIQILFHPLDGDATSDHPDDFADAFRDVVYIVAHSFGLDVEHDRAGSVRLLKKYRVTDSGQFKVIK